jgi:hypothetical protein
MKKNILIIYLLLVSTGAFAQNNSLLDKLSIELNGGIFSTKTIDLFIRNNTQHKYFYYFQGKENLNFVIYYQLNNRIMFSINQNYAKMFNKRTNNRSTLWTTTLNVNAILVKWKKFDIRLAVGSGFEQIHSKCLYDIYPFKNNFYGIPVKTAVSVNYSLNDKFQLLVNSDLTCNFLFYNKFIGTNSRDYQTCFNSFNFGLRYTFGKKEKQEQQ